MDKTELIASLNRLDTLLWVFGLIAAVGAVGSTTVGILRLRGGDQLQQLQDAENLALQKQVTNANTRANEAQAALDEFRAPRTLSAESASRISKSLSQFDKTPFALAVAVDDHEAFGLLDQIVPLLQRAGWRWVEWNPPGGPFMFVYTPAGKPNIGQDSSNVGVVVEINADHFGALEAPSTALVDALNAAGIVAKAAPGGADAPNHEAVSIRIGKKPQ